ncbi:superoxide dismutase family protein [Edaphobacter sp. HDX4]|uniref:superoxide dismutase family protein n=1 Tax=Edaphobacter sp. HDX4 TaxID=2794064 RepID=UPI002FE53D99
MSIRSLPLVSVLLLVSPCFSQGPATHSGPLKGADGASIGEVTVTRAPNGVLLRIETKGLPPGWHGMHFHERGDCSDSGFKNAGAHVHAKTPVVHGLLNADENGSGDLPNLYVAADGTATVEFDSSFVSMKGEGDRQALLDADGSALVVHTSPDDYKGKPIGGSGRKDRLRGDRGSLVFRKRGKLKRAFPISVTLCFFLQGGRESRNGQG